MPRFLPLLLKDEFAHDEAREEGRRAVAFVTIFCYRLPHSSSCEMAGWSGMPVFIVCQIRDSAQSCDQAVDALMSSEPSDTPSCIHIFICVRICLYIYISGYLLSRLQLFLL